MSYADGEYPTCTHEAHLTREVLDRWWEACTHEAHVTRDDLERWWATVAEPGEPATGPRGTQAIALQIEDLCDADD